jgi:hypothetical protein
MTGCSKATERQPDGVAETGDEQDTRDFVLESARDVPVLHEVDVVVVGGSSAAVTAAVAAAEGGAKVFLAAPRPYLGEDICGTYRLWLEPDEEPASALAKALFAEPQAAAAPGRSLSFTYKADVESASPHKDANPPSLLGDGKWHNAPSQSVQYNDAVTIVADLGAEQTIDAVSVMAYQRDSDFEVETVTVSTSGDGQQWQEVAVVKNGKLGQGSFEKLRLRCEISPKTVTSSRSPRRPRPSACSGGSDREEENGRDTCPVRRAMRVAGAGDTLLDAGVPFSTTAAQRSCGGRAGRPAGVVITNRSGRKLSGKVIIAPLQGAVAGARRCNSAPPGMQVFRESWSAARSAGEPIIRQAAGPVTAGDGRHEAQYTLGIPMKGSLGSLPRAEQIARRTWHPEQVGRPRPCSMCHRSRWRAQPSNAASGPGPGRSIWTCSARPGWSVSTCSAAAPMSPAGAMRGCCVRWSSWRWAVGSVRPPPPMPGEFARPRPSRWPAGLASPVHPVTCARTTSGCA